MRSISEALKKKCNTIFLLIVIAYLTHARWFFLFPMFLHPRLVVSLCSLIGCLCIKSFYKDVPGINKCLKPLFFLFAVELLLSWMNYPSQSVVDTTKQMLEYFVVLMALAMYTFARCMGCADKIERAIIIIGLIMSTLICIQIQLGIHISDLPEPSERIGVRYPFNAEPILFGTLFAVLHLFKKNNSSSWNKIYLAMVFIGAYEIVVIAQTRGIILMLAGGLISLFYYKSMIKSNNSKKQTFRYVVLLFVVFFIVSNSSIFKEYIAYSDMTSDTTANTMGIRAYESLYLIDFLLESPLNMLFGAGFISEHNMMFGLTDPITGNSVTLKEVTSDIGLLGFIGVFGLLGLIWLFGLIAYVLKILVKCYKRRIDASYLVAVFAIFVVGFYSLFLYNNERLPYFPLLLFYAFYYDYKVREFDKEHKIETIKHGEVS